MKLKSTSPDAQYTNISNVAFECDCGHTTDLLVASP
jgi:hypothetical protein